MTQFGTQRDEINRSEIAIDGLRFEQQRRKCLVSLSEFVRYTWSEIDPHVLIWSWHMEVICHHLECLYQGRCKNLIINIPPGHSKSLLSSVFFPAWIWLINPAYRFLCGARDKLLSTRDSVRCRDLIRSDKYQRLLVGAWDMKCDQDEKTYYVNNKGGHRIAVSVGSGTTGWRGDLRLVDDPSDAKEAKLTLASLRDVIEWWDGVMSTRIDPQQGKSLIIMQRLHYNDLCGHCLREYRDDYALLCLPTEYDPDNDTSNAFFDDPRVAKGELLFPDFYDAAAIKSARRTLGSYRFAAQHQQMPIPRKGGIIQHAWINYWTELPEAPWQKVIAYWDFAVEDKDTNSYVVGAVWGMITIDSITRYYLIDLVREHANIIASIRMVRSLMRKHPYLNEIVVEKKANGAPILQILKDEFPILVPDDPAGSKESRLHSVAPEFEAGLVLLPQAAPWLAGYVSELTRFPRAEHDDQVDVTSGGIGYLREGARRPGFFCVSV